MRHQPCLTVMLIVFLLLAACQVGTTPPEAAPNATNVRLAPNGTSAGAVDVVMIGFGAQEDERSIYAPLITTFNQQNPGIQIQFVALDAFTQSDAGQPIDPTQMLRRMVSAADIVSVRFISRTDLHGDLLRDLTPLIDADPAFQVNDFYPGAFDEASRNGGMYLLPRALEIRLLAYNKDLWAARGLTAPKLDWTWKDLVATAEQLAHKRGDTVTVYGMLDGSNGFSVLLNELTVADSTLFASPMNQIQLDRPEIAAALEHVVALAQSGAIAITSREPGVAISGDDVRKLIVEQRAALWPHALLFTDSNVDKPTFAIGVAPDPRTPLPLSDTPSGYVMSAGTQHPQEAWRWLAFLSKQAIMSAVAPQDPLSEIPARKSIAERSGYWTNLDVETTAAITAMIGRQATPPRTGTIDPRLFAALTKALRSVVSGKQRAQQALRAAQAELEQQLAQAQLTPPPTPDRAPVVVATPFVTAAPAGATTITFGTFAYLASEVRRLAEAFNQNHPDVYIQVKDNDPSGSLTEAAIASDCFMWWNPPQEDAITATLDLQPLIDAEPIAPGGVAFQTDFPPALLAPFRTGSGLSGLPYAVAFRVLTYNKQAFDAAGLSYPTANWTPDDFLNTAQKLTSGNAADKRYGYASMGSGVQDLLFFLDRLGASPTRGSGDVITPNFTDPKVVQAAHYYVTLLRDYSPHKTLMGYGSNNTFDVDLQLFSSGRIGMWFGDAPTTYAGWTQAGNFTKSMAPPPFGTGPISPEDVRLASGLFISAKTQQIQACWQWLTYLSRSPAALGPDVVFPARSSVAGSDAFLTHLPDGAATVFQAYQRAFTHTSAAASVREPLDSATFNYYWFFRAVDRALQGKNRMTNTGQALERELGEAQTLTEQYLACVRSGGQARACATQVDPAYEG